MAARSYGGGMAAVGGAGLVGAFPTLVRQQWPWTAGVGRRRHQFWIYIVKKFIREPLFHLVEEQTLKELI
jgi:hypothetical protein